MTLLTTLLISLAVASPVEADPPEDKDTAAALQLAMVYRNWLHALKLEEFEKAADRVLESDLRELQDRTVGRLYRQRQDHRLSDRLFNLGVDSVEELERMTPRDFFVAVMLAGGSPISGFLRAATVSVVDGGIDGDRGWLLVNITVSAEGGSRVQSQDIRQEFERVDGTWQISLGSGLIPGMGAEDEKTGSEEP